MVRGSRWGLLIPSPEPSFAAEDIPSPNEVRYIDRHGATSECIGDPRTPLCAIETWLGCKLRHDRRLCALVDRRSPRGAEWLLMDRLEYSIRWLSMAEDCGASALPDMAIYCPAQIPAAVIKVSEMDGNGRILATNTYRLLKDKEGWRIADIFVQGREMRLYREPAKGLY